MATEQAHGGQAQGLRLGGARADFVAGLGRKVSDLRSGLQRVRECPTDFPRREELRRKMHALSSAAKLMKFDAMERAIAEALGTIDRTDVDVALEEVDLASIDQVFEDLPALAWGDGDARVSRIEPVAKRNVATYSALVVGSALIAEALLDAAPECSDGTDATAGPRSQGGSGYRPTFACESTPDAQAAFDLARATEPDLIVLDADLDYATELVEALMDDPMTERAPIVVVGSFLEAGEAARYVAMGVAKTLAKPTSKPTLRDACEAALAAQRAPSVVPGGEATPHVDLPHGDRARTRLRGPAAEVRLQGRRIVVADDDPAVVWFLADLLKTSGCIVHEAFDGQEALEVAYRTSPDLVICDIMMPRLDGFALCRTLRRDAALSDVPVILLSWKEDLLQRVRELGAGAAGYVRKESDTRAIMARIREALRPRAHIELRLRDEGEVRGRMDGVSVRTLLEIVCATRPAARVTVRDASFTYEIDIRDGAPQRATRTSGDGRVLRGSRVLAAMLGVGAGRFTVTTSVSAIEADLDGNLAAQLAKPIARARAATALLNGTSGGIGGSGALKASRVVLDEEALEAYLCAMPELVRIIAQRIADGTPPRELVLEGACDASLASDLVRDLAARGVVARIEDEKGEDLLGPEITRLSQHADVRAAFAPRSATPPPMPAKSALAMARMPVANACANDAAAPLCESPGPSEVDPSSEPEREAASLEDAVMNQLAFHSPEPAKLTLPFEKASSLWLSTSPPPRCEDEGTPPHDQLLALAEPTIVDDTCYAERELSVSIPIDEASMALPPSESRAMNTPLTAVTTQDDDALGPLPLKRRAAPMVAFVAATGIVAWAVMHLSATAPATKHFETAPPPAQHAPPASSPPSDEITYSNVPSETDVSTGHGLLEVSAPGDAVIVVDGTDRGRGGATLPLWAGAHDVRISGAAGDRGRLVEVRPGRVAHVRF